MDEIDITNFAGDNTPYAPVDDIDGVIASLMPQYKLLKKTHAKLKFVCFKFFSSFFSNFWI